MEESHSEGLATHAAQGPCAGDRESEALTGVHTSWVLSRKIHAMNTLVQFRSPVQLADRRAADDHRYARLIPRRHFQHSADCGHMVPDLSYLTYTGLAFLDIRGVFPH